jgi:hypothetical protein
MILHESILTTDAVLFYRRIKQKAKDQALGGLNLCGKISLIDLAAPVKGGQIRSRQWSQAVACGRLLPRDRVHPGGGHYG